MKNAIKKSQKVQPLPFKEYVDAIGDPIRKSMFLARVGLETGKSTSCINRWVNGRTQPCKTERDAIARLVNDGRTGEDLFPSQYAYKGQYNAKAN